MTTGASVAGRTAVLDALQDALRAPSEHNAQPWRWTLSRDRLELAVDPHRRLPFTDESGRGALLACGATLHHFRVGLAVRGWTADVRYDDEGPATRRVAELSWAPGGAAPEEARRYAGAIARRHTDRRRFRGDPIEPSVLTGLDAAARNFGARVHVVAGVGRRHLVEAMRDAARIQRDAPGYAAELQRWTHRYPGGADGLPSGVRLSEPHLYGDLVLRWFPEGRLDQPRAGRDHEDASTLLVLSAAGGGQAALARAGEALSAVLLEATACGLATTPITHVLEIEATRDQVRRVVGDPGYGPVVVLRIGHPLSEDAPPRTPRRPLVSVLVDRTRDETDGDAG